VVAHECLRRGRQLLEVVFVRIGEVDAREELPQALREVVQPVVLGLEGGRHHDQGCHGDAAPERVPEPGHLVFGGWLLERVESRDRANGHANDGTADVCGGRFGVGEVRDTVADVVRIVVLALLAVALGVTGVLVASSYLGVDDVAMPDVRGVPYDRAIAVMRSLGLVPVTYPELDASVAPDAVASQTPAAGVFVRVGRTVRLGVNTLADARLVPTVVGLREPDAVARAASVDVAVARVSYVDSDRPAGTVVRQEPQPGAAVGPQGLHLVVSRGAASHAVIVPDVRGMTLDEAKRTLQELGIRQIDEIASAVSFDRPFSVTDQRPPPGSSVVASTPVTLVFALEGARVVRVPAVVGEPLWRAQLQLQAAQLTVGPVREVDDPTRPVGVVEVRPDTYTAVGGVIGLVVNVPGAAVDRSLGGGVDLLPTEHRDSTPVAPRLGSGRDGVLDLGARTGPATDRAATGATSADEADRVPPPGTTVLQSDGSRIIPFRFDPAQVGVASLTREPYELRLVVEDAQGRRTVFDRRLAAGEGVAVPVQVFGDEPLLQTFVNDSFFQAWRP
jgi:beta-lactam-binding protein with PASTA domain